jgi:hypothetical protein
MWPAARAGCIIRADILFTSLAEERAERAIGVVPQLHGHELRTSAIVIAQVWRSPGGKQAGVARLLRAVDVRPVDEKMGRGGRAPRQGTYR